MWNDRGLHVPVVLLALPEWDISLSHGRMLDIKSRACSSISTLGESHISTLPLVYVTHVTCNMQHDHVNSTY